MPSTSPNNCICIYMENKPKNLIKVIIKVSSGRLSFQSLIVWSSLSPCFANVRWKYLKKPRTTEKMSDQPCFKWCWKDTSSKYPNKNAKSNRLFFSESWPYFYIRKIIFLQLHIYSVLYRIVLFDIKSST